MCWCSRPSGWASATWPAGAAVSRLRCPRSRPSSPRGTSCLGPARRCPCGDPARRSVECRYAAANRREIVVSRVHSVEAIGGAIRRCARPPSAWVQTGSLAIYGDAGDRVCDETGRHGDGFSVEVCEQWEAKVEEQVTPGTRKTILRIGFALGRGGGALEKLVRLARLGLGGTVGSGRQYISWLHVSDL